jgi:hypothetical protein
MPQYKMQTKWTHQKIPFEIYSKDHDISKFSGENLAEAIKFVNGLLSVNLKFATVLDKESQQYYLFISPQNNYQQYIDYLTQQHEKLDKFTVLKKIKIPQNQIMKKHDLSDTLYDAMDENAILSVLNATQSRAKIAIIKKSYSHSGMLYYKTTPALDDYFLDLLEAKLKKIKVVAFDFDNTILRIHSYGERIKPEEVEKRMWKTDFADYDFMLWLITALIKIGKKIAIVSFGCYEVIKEYMNRLMSEVVISFNGLHDEVKKEDFNENTILTPRLFQYTVKGEYVHINLPDKTGQPLRDGTQMNDKNALLNLLRGKLNIEDKESVLFFDDSSVNYKRALLDGYIHSFLVCSPGLTKQYFYEVVYDFLKV